MRVIQPRRADSAWLAQVTLFYTRFECIFQGLGFCQYCIHIEREYIGVGDGGQKFPVDNMSQIHSKTSGEVVTKFLRKTLKLEGIRN